MGPDYEIPEASAQKQWPYGPCLYLGPQGQRCERPALEDGFCERHSPEYAGTRSRFKKQIVAVILLLAGLLWPLLHELLRTLSRWIKK